MIIEDGDIFIVERGLLLDTDKRVIIFDIRGDKPDFSLGSDDDKEKDDNNIKHYDKSLNSSSQIYI